MQLIIIIWTIILNSSFIYAWGNKEKLKKWKPVKVKEDKNNEVILGKINGFTIFNFIYILLTSKACFELLKSLGELSRLELYIANRLEMKTLDEITKFIFDTGNFIGLFIGLTGMLVAIYIYAVSIDNKLKKFMLITLIGKESLFYLSFYIVILFLFGTKSIFLIGPIGYLIYRLTDSVKWVVNINSASSYRENFKYVMKNIFTDKDKNDLYEEIKKSLYKVVKEEELLEIEENKYYFNEYFDNYGKELNYISKDIKFGNVISFLNDLYEEVSFNKNSKMFQKINYLHIKIANYYFKNNDKDMFCRSLMVMVKVYDYYDKDAKDDLELSVVSGFRFDTFGIYEKYKGNFKEGIEWYCQKFKVIVEGIKRTVKNNDLYFFKQFIYLIEQEFEYKDNLKRDYKLLEKSVYFGVLLYLREEKIKNQDDKNIIKKIDRFIEFVEKKKLNDSDWIDLIDLYEFIGEKIYLEFESDDRLNWDEYFRPKIELIKGVAHEVRTKREIKKLFFKLLGKTKFEEWETDKLDIEKSFNYYQSNNEEIDVKEERETLIKRINDFKKKANWLLNDLKEYKKELTLTDKEYEKIRELLENIKIANQNQEDKSVIDSEISESKITLFKEELEVILSKSKIIKWLNNLGKYKKGIKEKKGEARYRSQYMEKEYFVELGDEGGTKAIAKSYGKGQNRAIEQIIIESIEVKKEEINSIEEALEKIKEKPLIILTGIGIHSFFYNESGKDRKNIVLSSDLDKKYFEKYGEILEGIYKYKGAEIPIYNFSSDKKGIYILDSNDIEEFVHYDANDEDGYDKNILKKFDDKVDYAHLKITDTKDIIEAKGEEGVLKYEFLKGDGTPEEKIEKFRQRVLVAFAQKGELKLKDNTVVYKVEFNG